MASFQVKTNSKEELLDITFSVRKVVLESKIQSGLCCIYVPHTTAAVTINENADPDVKSDILKGLAGLKLENMHFDHTEGNSPAHIKSSIIGSSQTILIENNDLCLGTWQGIFFCEFDGPRTRKVYVKTLKEH